MSFVVWSLHYETLLYYSERHLVNHHYSNLFKEELQFTKFIAFKVHVQVATWSLVLVTI